MTHAAKLRFRILGRFIVAAGGGAYGKQRNDECGSIEPFNGRWRDERLSGEFFETVLEARMFWRQWPMKAPSVYCPPVL